MSKVVPGLATRLARRLPPGPKGGTAKRGAPSDRAISRRRDNHPAHRECSGRPAEEQIGQIIPFDEWLARRLLRPAEGVGPA